MKSCKDAIREINLESIKRRHQVFIRRKEEEEWEAEMDEIRRMREERKMAEDARMKALKIPWWLNDGGLPSSGVRLVCFYSEVVPNGATIH